MAPHDPSKPAAPVSRRDALRRAARHPRAEPSAGVAPLRRAVSVPLRGGAEPRLQSAMGPEPVHTCDLFVSYARQDQSTVAHLIATLRARGIGVSWDQDFDAGRPFDEQIEAGIDGARATTVVWSDASTASRFVRDEASRAFRAQKLVATHVPGFDLDRLPLGFGTIHAVSIHDLDGLARSLVRFGIAFG